MVLVETADKMGLKRVLFGLVAKGGPAAARVNCCELIRIIRFRKKKENVIMDRREFMKLSAATAAVTAASVVAPAASAAEVETINAVHTDAEVQAMVAEELKKAREVAFYPHAFKGDFDQFYVLFHKLSRHQYEAVDGKPAGITADDYDMCVALTKARESLWQVVKDPKSTVWEIWGDKMAVESPLPTTGWEISYDNEGFRPFLNPYLLKNQKKVKGNVIIIAGGGSTHRNNVVEGYPVAEFYNKNGYNAFVLQRRVNPYASVDQQLDLARAIRYIRYYAEEKNIAKTDVVIAVGFSAGGNNIMQLIANQYGHQTPDLVYPDYVCDAVDHESADIQVAVPVYGLFYEMDYSKNANLPALFAVSGGKDALTAYTMNALNSHYKTFPDFSFYLAPDAPHGIGLGNGTKNYVNAYTQIAQWPEMSINFIESRLGIQEKSYEKNGVAFAW